MSNRSAKIRVQNLTKIFGTAAEEALQMLADGASKDEIFAKTKSVVAVSEVSFTVGQGEIFVVMGLSGSGKSTLIRCINRLIEPTAGQLLVDDEDLLRADADRLRQIRLTKIAMVFQHFALFPHKTVAENVEFGLKVRGVEPQERREKGLRALDMVGLKAWADTAPGNLSGGMQQRVGLARGLAVDAEVLLMDEPFSALDPLIRREMQAELIELQRRLGITIVFITHDLHEALILGTQIAIMKDGRFVQVGTPEEIVAHPGDPYVAAFTQDVDRGRVLTAQRVMRPAALLPRDGASVTAARAKLDEIDSPAVYVTADGDAEPVAMALAGDVRSARGGVLDPYLRTDFPRVRQSTKLYDMFEQCASGLPVAVVDDAGRLLGVVRPLEVFGELTGDAQGQDAAAIVAGQEATQAAQAGATHG